MHKRLIVFLALLAATLPFAAQAQWTWTPETGRFVNAKRMPRETPELQVEFARSLMVDGKYDRALRETYKFEEFYADTEWADDNLFLRGEILMADGKLKKAAKQFQQLITAHPETKLFDKAIAKQYEIGDTYYERAQQRMKHKFRPFKKSPLKNAIEVYSQVISCQPFTAAAAQAQYKVGLCHYARGEYKEAAYEYRRVIEDYSGSDWVDEASYGLATCYCDASHPAAYDQTPSKLAVDAIDQFLTRYPDDARVAELKPKREKMRALMAEQRIQTAKFYERQRKFDSARLCYEVVSKDFADTSWAQEAKGWLDQHPKEDTETQKKVGQLREANP